MGKSAGIVGNGRYLAKLLLLNAAVPAAALGQEPAEPPVAQGAAPDNRADDAAAASDALARSDDAFGQTVGNESTGLYSSSRVRGFDPTDAGNARIEGLYYDQAGGLSGRLRDRSGIRIGLGARGYALPAPTGVVDHSLNRPGGGASLTIDADTNLGEHSGGSIEASIPLPGVSAGLFAGVGVFSRLTRQGSSYLTANFASVLEVRPAPGAELLAFVSGQLRRDDEARPTIFPAGDQLPELEAGHDLTQPWADSARNNEVWGLIAKAPVANLEIEAGAFFDRRHDSARYTDLLLGVTGDGTVADRIMLFESGRRVRSISGEFRVGKQLSRGHRVTASLRLRDRQRRYGASDRQSLGPTTLAERDPKPMPQFHVGALQAEQVTQLSAGLAYTGVLGYGFTLDAGGLWTDYRRNSVAAGLPASGETATDHRLLWNFGLQYQPVDALTLFTAAVRGLEEARDAPDQAVNAAENPAAVLTRQEEAGLRYAPSSALSLTVGLFRIAKPYFNLDSRQYYRRLGTLGSRGLELSLVARPYPGVTTLFGVVAAEPEVSGEAATSGLIGRRPVAMERRRAVANLDIRPQAGTSPWSFDLACEFVGRRAANTANTLFVPAYSKIDLGFRYRMDLGQASILLRGRFENAFDTLGWEVSPSGGLTIGHPRRFTLQLVTQI